MAKETDVSPTIADVNSISDAQAVQDFQNNILAQDAANNQVNNPFQFNLAAPSPVEPSTPEIKAAEVGARPEYVQGQVAGPADIEGTQRVLEKETANLPALEQQQVAEPTAADFAVPAAEPVQQAQPAPFVNPFEQVFKQQAQAQRAIAKATVDKSEAEVAAQEQMQKQMAEQQQKIQQHQEAFNQDWSSKSKYLSDAADELKKQDFSAPEISAGHFWNSRSTGDKILASLAIALGGWGQGLTGKNNVALDMINKAIDNDIEVQKFNAAKQMEAKQQRAQNIREQVSIGNTMLDNLRQKFGSEMAAEQAFKLLAIEQTQSKLNQLASKFNANAAPEQAKILGAQLDQQKIQLEQQLKAQQMQQYMVQSILKGGVNGEMSELQMAAAGVPKEMIDQVRAVRERGAPGWEGLATTKENAQKFIERSAEIKPAVAAIDRITALAKDYNRFSDLKKRAEIESEVAGLVGALRLPMTGPGILTDSERKMLETVIGSPNDFLALPSIQKARMAQIRKKLDADINTTAKTYGFRPKTENVKQFLTPLKK